MVDEAILSPEEKLTELSSQILATILDKSPSSKNLRRSVLSQLTPKVFRDENYIIYKVLYKFKDRGIVPDEEFIRMYLMRNENVILDSKQYIDINAFAELDDNPATAYLMAVLRQFNRLKALPVLAEEEFNLVFEKFKIEFRNVRLNDTFKECENILEDGIELNKRVVQGADAAISHFKLSLADIESVMDNQAGTGFIDSSIAGLEDDETDVSRKIGDFGLLTELNEYLGGIYAPLFYSIVAPTKGGKSKFTTRLIHNIVVENGNSVVVWAQEGGHKAWWAQLRAIHYDWFYNRNEIDITKHKTGVSQDIILHNKFANDDIRLLEDASRVDLFTNESYGNIIMIDRPFKVETFIDELETAVKANGASAVLIDYLQLIQWETRGMSKNQAISQAYQKLLAFCKKMNVAAISPAQMTQDFMNELSRSKEGTTHETRTSGGESAEVIRTPDINIALYGTIEDIRAGSMKILSMPSRMAAPFPTFDIYCNLGICQFASLK